MLSSKVLASPGFNALTAIQLCDATLVTLVLLTAAPAMFQCLDGHSALRHVRFEGPAIIVSRREGFNAVTAIQLCDCYGMHWYAHVFGGTVFQCLDGHSALRRKPWFRRRSRSTPRSFNALTAIQLCDELTLQEPLCPFPVRFNALTAIQLCDPRATPRNGKPSGRVSMP